MILCRGEREHRYLVSRVEAETFLNAIAGRVRLEVYDEARPVAYSRTTYLDSRDRDYFHSCSDTVVRRARIREYAAASDVSERPELTGTCFLEYKESAGAARTKVRLALPPDVLHAIARGGEIDDRWRAQLSALPPLHEIAQRLRHGLLAPRMTTWYRRVSLTGDSVRITMDEGVALCPPIRLADACQPVEPRSTAHYVPGRILEIKLRDEPPAWLARAMDPLPRETRFSKFRAGMIAVQRKSTAPTYRTQPLAVIAPILSRSADGEP